MSPTKKHPPQEPWLWSPRSPVTDLRCRNLRRGVTSPEALEISCVIFEWNVFGFETCTIYIYVIWQGMSMYYMIIYYIVYNI